MKNIILLTAFIISISTAFPMQWKKCSKVTFSGQGFGAFVSSSQFSSSTGECAMFGKLEDQSIKYIASNYDLMLINSAQGKGEYLSAYLNLSTCSSNNLAVFEGLMKKNIKMIYGDKLDNQPEQVYKNINILIKNDKNLQNKCEIIES